MENTTKKSWQEELQEMLEKLPEEKRQRAHDFLAGCIATMQAEQAAS